MLYIASDHNGFALKNGLSAYLEKLGLLVNDLTPHHVANDDYPKIAEQLTKAIKRKPGSIGILLCGSGNGMAMAANRMRGIRAALAPSPAYAHKAKTDEDANVIVIPAWWVTPTQAKRIVRTWLSSHASTASRHQRRIRQLDRIHG